MTNQEFIEALNSGEQVKCGSSVHLKMHELSQDALRITADGKSDEQIATEGLAAMESWMKEIGLVMNLSELGVTDDMTEGIADGTLIMDGGYKVLTRDEIVQILKECM